MVDGAGSTWSSGGFLYVGNGGSGVLSITNGDNVSSTSSSSGGSCIGNNSGTTGVVRVDGVGSAWVWSSGLTVGNSGSGTLSITNGASVSSTGRGNITVGSSPYGPASVVTVDGPGSTLTGISSLFIEHGSVLVRNGGIVNSGAGFSFGTSLYAYSGGTLSITGGSTVTAVGASLSSGSLLTIDVGRGRSAYRWQRNGNHWQLRYRTHSRRCRRRGGQ